MLSDFAKIVGTFNRLETARSGSLTPWLVSFVSSVLRRSYRLSSKSAFSRVILPVRNFRLRILSRRSVSSIFNFCQGFRPVGVPLCPVARLHVPDPTDSVFVTSPLLRKLWGANPKQTAKKRASNFIGSGSELKTIVSPGKRALDSYNLFNGNGEFDMAPKEKTNVGFTPDTAPPSPELHGCSGQGTIELEDAKPVLLPSQRVSPLDTENTNASQAHPAPEYDYSTPRLRRNSVSERDLARQLSVAAGAAAMTLSPSLLP